MGSGKIAVNNLKLAGAELGNTILEVLAPILDSISEKVNNFQNGLEG